MKKIMVALCFVLAIAAVADAGPFRSSCANGSCTVPNVSASSSESSVRPIRRFIGRFFHRCR